MARSFHVVSVGYDRSLMASRSLLLRNAGYAVEEAYSRHQALALVRSDSVDILLLCHTISENEKRALISALRKQRLLIPILCVNDNDFLSRPGEDCIFVSNAPAELLAAVDLVVRETPRQQGP